MTKNILYVSRSGLPIDAAGIRTFHIGSILERLSARVHYISSERAVNEKKYSDFERILDRDGFYLRDDEIHFLNKNKVYSYLPPISGGKLVAAKEIAELYFAKNFFARVKNYCEKENPFAIILYNDAFGLTKKLIPYCKSRGIKLFADVTEWYEKDKNKNFAEKLIVGLTDKRIRTLDKELDGVISISKFFDDHYEKEGVENRLLVPPLMPVEKEFCATKHNYYPDKNVINFVYAGSPGGKDILLPFLEALQKANENGITARIDIAGLDAKYFEKYPQISRDLSSVGIFPHGRLSHGDTVALVKKADFGILLRYDLRYAKAGFSTKLCECMSVGVPMICNKIGGSDSVIEHMKNGILTETADKNELFELIKTLVSLDSDALVELKKNAHSYAASHFSCDGYDEEFKKFLGI